jgi:hemolysin D
MRLEPFRRHVAVWNAAWVLDKARPKLASRTSTELAFLPAVIEIIETPASPLGRAVSLTICALFASALAWSWFGQVDIHATAQGRIIPGGKTKQVAATEAASVAAIHVQDGDHVLQGQDLIDLDPTNPQADAARLEREGLEQQVTAARLRALLDGRGDISLPSVAADSPGLQPLLAVNRQELQHKLADHRATIAGLQQERSQRESEKRGTEADIQRLQQTVPLLEERSRMKGSLSEEGYVSRTEYLQVQQDYIDRKQELESAGHKLAQAYSAINSANEKLRQTEEQFRADSLSQLAEAEQRAASTAQDLVKARDRRLHYLLTAPVSGTVQQLAVHASGAVVSQAQPLLMIVPDNEGIAVEAALPNKDAGFVLPGQAVEIKVEAFPFTRYRTIAGEVQHISGDAMQGPDSDPTQRRQSSNTGQTADNQGAVYSVRIKPLADHIRADGRDVALTPGMAVTAEIKTGRRRVIEYVLDPVLRYRDESLTER